VRGDGAEVRGDGAEVRGDGAEVIFTLCGLIYSRVLWATSSEGLLYSHSVVYSSSLSVVSSTAESGGSLTEGLLYSHFVV
jgi:hypothetical protein